MKIGDRVRGGAGSARDEIGDVIHAIEQVRGWESNGRLRNARVRLIRARTQIDSALVQIGPAPERRTIEQIRADVRSEEDLLGHALPFDHPLIRECADAVGEPLPETWDVSGPGEPQRVTR